MTGDARGQAVKSATLEENGVQFQFGRSSSGKVLTVYASHLGEVGVLKIDAEGNAYLDLAKLRPPQSARACFFLINPANREFVSVSGKEGFFNPLWEQRDVSGRSDRPARAPATIAADEARLDQQVAEARAQLARQQGERYVNGQCRSPALVEALRPAYAFVAPNNFYYAALRCAKVIEPTPLTCPALDAIMGAQADRAFAASQCPRGLSDARTVIAQGRDPATRTRHEGIAANALGASRGEDGRQRQDAAAQCILTIAQDSTNQLQAWRDEKKGAELAEESAMKACQDAVAILADEQVIRAELAAERARAAQQARHATKPATSRQARDFACSIR